VDERVTYVGHATVLVEVGGARMLTDPILRGRVAHLRRHGGTVDHLSLGRLDAVLVSHAHLDHLHAGSLKPLAGLDPQPALIVPPGAGRHVAKLGFADVREVAVGERTEVAGVEVLATPAVHDGRRHPFGPPGEAVGYLIGDPGRRVYFAGDTDIFDAMADLAAGLDLALVPVWGWGPSLGPGHLDPHEAAEALRLLRPRVVVPIHWGTLFPFALDLVRGNAGLLSDPPHRFAARAAERAPEVEVRVLRPGEATPLPPPR